MRSRERARVERHASRVVRTTSLGLVEKLDRELFNTSAPVETSGRVWWLAMDGRDPVAFAGLRIIGGDAYLSRAGVIKRCRGRGIHGRLIRARVNYARAHGCAAVYTYTVTRNAPSSNNLIRAGFRLWVPESPWFADDSDVNYWRLRIGADEDA